MVRAIFRCSDGELEMRMQGHARFDEYGKDPVCAGASVLAFTLAQCIDSIADQDGMKVKPSVRVGSGTCRVKCRPKEEVFGQVLTIYQTVQVGMLLLSEAYPDHAAVKTFAAADAEAIEDSSTSRTD